MAVEKVVGEGEAERAGLAPIPSRRLQLPAYAAHLAEAALRKEPNVRRHQTTLQPADPAGAGSGREGCSGQARTESVRRHGHGGRAHRRDRRRGRLRRLFRCQPLGLDRHDPDQPLAGLDAQALHLWPRLRGGPGQPGNDHRGSAGRFLRLPATQFRHELSGRCQHPAGAAAVAQRAGRAPARCRRSDAADGAVPPRRSPARSCRRTRRRALRSASAVLASR